MIEYTLTQQAEIMANARKIHKSKCGVENREIAIQMGLASDKKSADALCLNLGLVPWGKRTALKEIEFYLDAH